MSEKNYFLELWLKDRSPREQLMMLFIILAVTYLMWDLLIDRPVRVRNAELTLAIKKIEIQQIAITKEVNSILDIVKNSSYLQSLREYKSLAAQSNIAKKDLNQMLSLVVPESKLSRITNDVSSRQPNITFTSIKKLPEQAWIPDEIIKDLFPNIKKHLVRHRLQLDFRGDYFGTLNYFIYLEKLPWNLHWESLQYSVKEYPVANVSVVIYSLTEQAG